MITAIGFRNGKRVDSVPPSQWGAFRKDKKSFLWVDFEAATPDELTLLDSEFQFHPLAVEDASNATVTLPKIDLYDGYSFIVFHRLTVSPKTGHTVSSELDAFIAPHYLVTAHAQPSDSINAVKPLVGRDERFSRPDGVLYGVVDRVVEKFDSTLNELERDVTTLEDEILGGKRGENLRDVMHLRREIGDFRARLAQQLSVMRDLSEGQVPYVLPRSQRYFRDAYDRVNRAVTSLDLLRERVTTAYEAHLSAVSYRTNEVMKKLTVVSTIFMPITFLVGVYGMNFQYLPELHVIWFYPALWAFMAFISVAQVLYFKRKGWL